MQLIIESSDEKVLQTIVELIRPFNVVFREVKDVHMVSPLERKRRVAILKKFRGGLKNRLAGYEPPKNEWYEQ